MPEETGTPAEGTPTPEAAPTATPEWAPVLDRVNELAGNIDTRFAEIEGRFPQPEPEPEVDFWSQLAGEDPEPEPEPAALDLAQLQQAVQQQITQALTPYQQKLQAYEAAQGRQQLYEQIPQLKDPAVAQETIQGMQQFLAESGATPEVASFMVNNPQQIALYFKAAEAEKLAASQAPASEQVPAVESAGGAVPGGNGEPPDYIHQAYEGGWQGLPARLR